MEKKNDLPAMLKKTRACSRESKLGRSVEKHFTDKNP